MAVLTQQFADLLRSLRLRQGGYFQTAALEGGARTYPSLFRLAEVAPYPAFSRLAEVGQGKKDKAGGRESHSETGGEMPPFSSLAICPRGRKWGQFQGRQTRQGPEKISRRQVVQRLLSPALLSVRGTRRGGKSR